MIETQCQQLVVDAVVNAGGRALKFNNRFLVGVVDLLIKMPLYPAFVLEAKKHDFAANTINRDGVFTFDLGVTEKQKKFLREWHGAGMAAGVISFIQQKGANVNSLRAACYHYEDLCDVNWTATVQDHALLGDTKTREASIIALLDNFARGA